MDSTDYKSTIFFSLSNFDGDANSLELGQEVEYNLGLRSNSGTCSSAENVKIVPKGVCYATVNPLNQMTLKFSIQVPLNYRKYPVKS